MMIVDFWENNISTFAIGVNIVLVSYLLFSYFHSPKQRSSLPKTIITQIPSMPETETQPQTNESSNTLVQIYIMRVHSPGSYITIDLAPTDILVKDVKLKIKAMEDIPVGAQRLVFAGTYLDDDNKHLNDLKVEHESTLHLVVVDDGKSVLSITIKKLSNGGFEILELEVEQSETIGSVKERMDQKWGLNQQYYSYDLIWAGAGMKNERTIGDYKIEDGSSLHLVGRYRPPS